MKHETVVANGKIASRAGRQALEALAALRNEPPSTLASCESNKVCLMRCPDFATRSFFPPGTPSGVLGISSKLLLPPQLVTGSGSDRSFAV